MPDATMLPMSQPTALKASEAPAAAPEEPLTAVPARLLALSADALRACTARSPSLACSALLSTKAWLEPVSWFQAKVPPNDIWKPLVPEAPLPWVAPETAIDSSVTVKVSRLSASKATSLALTLLFNTLAKTRRSTVLLVEAMPSLIESSLGMSAENPALVAW